MQQPLKLNSPARLSFPPAAPGSYRHQPFPSIRYHPDGSTRVVSDEDEDRTLGEEWAHTPYPPIALPPPAVPSVTVPAIVPANLAVELDALRQQKAELQTANGVLQESLKTVAQEREDMKSLIRDQQAELKSLRAAVKKAAKAEDAKGV